MTKTLNKWLDEFVEKGANPNNVTEWPENAGGGSSQIVDSLPADGVEGQTYLLRHTTEFPPIRFKCYTWVYSNESRTDAGRYFIVTDDYTSKQIMSAFLEKVGYDMPATPIFSMCSVWTEAEFEESFGDGKNVIYVSNEEEFINADLSSYPDVLQYHGIIGLEDLIFTQHVDLGNVYFTGYKNDLLTQITITDGQITRSSRQTSSNDGHGYFEPWYSETVTLAETLTDACEESPEFWQEHQNEIVKINITGQTEYEYSYTEYVFDHGVYTEIGAKNAGASTKKAVAYINDSYPFAITFECDDTSISTYADLLNYLKTKGYSSINAESEYYFPTLACSCVGECYALSGNSVSCIYATMATD